MKYLAEVSQAILNQDRSQGLFSADVGFLTKRSVKELKESVRYRANRTVAVHKWHCLKRAVIYLTNQVSYANMLSP